MSARVYTALRGAKARKSWQSLVDYSIQQLTQHIERQFTGGMSWENMGAWHIDHIVPLTRFNYTTACDPEFRRAWSLTNLRPLWARDNLSKGGKCVTLL
jgi:hypothetical protein